MSYQLRRGFGGNGSGVGRENRLEGRGKGGGTCQTRGLVRIKPFKISRKVGN